MQFAPSLIFITAVWSIVDCASIAQNANYSPHLIGGTPVDKNVPQPAVGVLQVKDKNGKLTKSCGATLIKRDSAAYFVTAAECLDKTGDEQVFSLRYFKENGQLSLDYAVQDDYKIHPYYGKNTKENNLAIFKTEQQFTDVTTQPLLPEEDIPVRQPVEIFSWENSTTGDQNSILHSFETATVTTKWCETNFPSSPLRGFQVCLKGDNNQGVTEHDIGAPVIQRDPKDNKRFTLVGMVAFVRRSADFIPMECLNILSYMPWIKTALSA